MDTPLHRQVARAQSPTFERMEEKRVMNELNGRLESYIQHVLHLSKANDELRQRLEEARGTPGSLSPKIYDDQIKLLNDKVEATQRGKALLERDLAKKADELAKAARENEELARALKKLEDEKIGLEQRLPDLENQLQFLNRLRDEERDAAARKLAEKEEELERLRDESNADFDKRLEREREEWKLRSDDELRQILASRGEALSRLEQEKEAMEVDITNLQVQNTSLAGEVEVLNGRVAEFSHQNKVLLSQVEKLTADRDIERTKVENLTKLKAAEVSRLRGELANMQREFVDLTNAKFALDAEIQSYRRLLSAGENRLGLAITDGSSHPSSRPALGYSVSDFIPSRKRPAEEEIFSPKKVRKALEPDENESGFTEALPYRFVHSTRGIVNIEELNPEGQYIRISNPTTSEINLSDWWLQIGLNAGYGTREVQPKRFKFPTDSILPAEDSIKVLVKITDDSNGSQDNDAGAAISFSSSLIQVGAFIQLFNDADALISQVDLREGKEGTFDRVCALM